MGKEAHTGQSGSDASLFLLTTDGTAPRTDYILDWSPGARVGQAWLNVETMNGNGVLLVWERYRDRGLRVGCGQRWREGKTAREYVCFQERNDFLYGPHVLDECRYGREQTYLNLDPVGRWRVCDAGGRDHAHPECMSVV